MEVYCSSSGHVQRQRLRLVSVLCIHSSHYVTFANTNCSTHANDDSLVGLGQSTALAGDRTMLMHDSMADRCGAEGGYCLPQVTPCPDIRLSREGEEEVCSPRGSPL